MIDEVPSLFAEPVQVGGYAVRPWTLKRFTLVYPAAKAMVDRLVTAGLTFDNVEDFLAHRVLDVLPELLPLLPEFLAVSLDIPLAEAEELDWATAAALVVTIFTQNLAPLKNCLTLIPAAAGIGVSTPSS